MRVNRLESFDTTYCLNRAYWPPSCHRRRASAGSCTRNRLHLKFRLCLYPVKSPISKHLEFDCAMLPVRSCCMTLSHLNVVITPRNRCWSWRTGISGHSQSSYHSLLPSQCSFPSQLLGTSTHSRVIQMAEMLLTYLLLRKPNCCGPAGARTSLFFRKTDELSVRQCWKALAVSETRVQYWQELESTYSCHHL